MYASAFVVGPDDGPGLALEQLCEEIGFKHVLWFGDMADAEEQAKITPTCFFVFTSALDIEVTRQVVIMLRSSRNRQIQFAPLVGFCEQPTKSAIRDYLNIGFDDILVPPFHAGYVLPRLEMMLGRRTVYYETDTYFGPDRRRMLGVKDRGHHLRGRGGDHRRIELVRDANVGVKILKDQQFKASNRSFGIGSAARNNNVA